MAESVSLSVQGMKCGGCESNVTEKLNALNGVISVVASSKENKVEIEYDAEQTSLDELSKAITEAGFVVE